MQKRSGRGAEELSDSGSLAQHLWPWARDARSCAKLSWGLEVKDACGAREHGLTLCNTGYHLATNRADVGV